MRSGSGGSKWCARSCPQPRERSHPRRASRLDAFGRAEDQRRIDFGLYAITTSRKGVLVRHMACRVTANFRASATLALRGPVLSAIAFAQSRSRGPPKFRQKMAFAAQHAARVAGIHADDRHLPLRQRVPEPDSQRTGLHADPFETFGSFRQPVGNRIRAGRHLRLKRPASHPDAPRRSRSPLARRPALQTFPSYPSMFWASEVAAATPPSCTTIGRRLGMAITLSGVTLLFGLGSAAVTGRRVSPDPWEQCRKWTPTFSKPTPPSLMKLEWPGQITNGRRGSASRLQAESFMKSACLGDWIRSEGGHPQMDDLLEPTTAALGPWRQTPSRGILAEKR